MAGGVVVKYSTFWSYAQNSQNQQLARAVLPNALHSDGQVNAQAEQISPLNSSIEVWT